VTFNLEAGAAAAAGAFFMLRSIPLVKGIIGLVGSGGNGNGTTETYLRQIAENTQVMRDSLVGLNVKFDQHDHSTSDSLREIRDRL
jgi:hypothetical protein